MPVFWRSFLKNGSAGRALREAKLAFLERARSGDITIADLTERGMFKRVKAKADPRHPFFWAGFVLLTREVEP